jgi:hypothetical protein
MQFFIKFLIQAVLMAVVMLSVLVWGVNHGKAEGKKEALRVNPPSEDLEMVCLGLWVGEQNRKWYEKEKNK